MGTNDGHDGHPTPSPPAGTAQSRRARLLGPGVMIGGGKISRSIGEGLYAGARQSWSKYRTLTVLDGHLEGFEDAFLVADAVPGWFDEVSAACFWSVIHELKPRQVVEIGSYLGRSTVFIAEALRHAGISNAELHSIDPHTGDRQHLQQLGLTNLPTFDLFRVFISASGNGQAVQTHVAPSSEVVRKFGPDLDFVFVDGWHQYDAVLADVRDFGKLLSDDGVMAIDDVTKLNEVDQASREGLSAAGLTHYGTIAGKAWAGRRAEPPQCLEAAFRLQERWHRVASPFRS
jgi:MMP 1-O-methyltransferase